MRQILSVAGRVHFNNQNLGVFTPKSLDNDKSVLYSKQEKQFVLIEVFRQGRLFFVVREKFLPKTHDFKKALLFRRKSQFEWLTLFLPFRIIFYSIPINLSKKHGA